MFGYYLKGFLQLILKKARFYGMTMIFQFITIV